MLERVIEQKLELSASQEHVWQAITDPEKISRWFGDEAEIDLKANGHGVMSWKDHGCYAVRVEEVTPPHRLVWSWVHEPGVAFEDAPSTRVEWELTTCENGSTALSLRETGFLTALHHEQNMDGWKHELRELEELLATG